VSVVPVGLTEFSKHSLVREPTTDECKSAVRRLEAWQGRAIAERAAHWVYGADELYLRAALELPAEASYEEFDQVENGVGSVRFLQRRIRESADLFSEWQGRRIGVITGTSMGALMPQVLAPLAAASGAEFELIPVENGLFGPRVTTAGLLPGQSIASALQGRSGLDFALLPAEAVNDDLLFIDGMSAETLAAGLPLPIRFSKHFSDALELGAAA
jgi:NifB/MoaA-like Fe-S oxidoreductase